MDVLKKGLQIVRRKPVRILQLLGFIPFSIFSLVLFLFLFSAQYSVLRRQLFVQHIIDTYIAQDKFQVGFSPDQNTILTYDLMKKPKIDTCMVLQPVQIQLPGRAIPVFTCADSDASVLGEVFPGQSHEISGETSVVFAGKIITATPVEKTARMEFEQVAYATETWYSNDIEDGKKVVKQAGQPGVRAKVIEEIVYPDNQKKTQVISSWMEKEPVIEKVEIGTKRIMKTATIDGVTFQYWKTLDVVATSYDKNCKGCNEWTATGAYLKKGIVAVDPKVIKMHTKMYIPGYGFGQAEDTGGAIKGNKIDLAFDDVRYGNWSKRTVTIYLIN